MGSRPIVTGTIPRLEDRSYQTRCFGVSRGIQSGLSGVEVRFDLPQRLGEMDEVLV
jgi:hypothetical protein